MRREDLPVASALQVAREDEADAAQRKLRAALADDAATFNRRYVCVSPFRGPLFFPLMFCSDGLSSPSPLFSFIKTKQAN